MSLEVAIISNVTQKAVTKPSSEESLALFGKEKKEKKKALVNRERMPNDIPKILKNIRF